MDYNAPLEPPPQPMVVNRPNNYSAYIGIIAASILTIPVLLLAVGQTNDLRTQAKSPNLIKIVTPFPTIRHINPTLVVTPSPRASECNPIRCLKIQCPASEACVCGICQPNN